MTQHLGVAPVGAADDQHNVGSRVDERGHGGDVEPTGSDVDDSSASREPDAVAGLGRDGALVSDDGEPQPAAGAGAEHDVLNRHTRGCSGELGPYGVDAVEQVGVQRRTVRGDREERTALGVDGCALGVRRADVHADDGTRFDQDPSA